LVALGLKPVNELLKNDDFDTYLAHERAKHAHEHALISFLSEVGVACLTVGLIWRMFSHTALLVWLGGAVAVSVLALWTHKTLIPTNLSYTPTKWRWATTITSMLVGLIWGIVSVLFFAPDNSTYLVFMLAIYTGYISGAQAVTFTFQPSFIGFTLGISTPFIGRMFYEGGELYTSVGVLCVFYISTLIYVSNNTNKLFIKSVRAQYKNDRLVNDLAKEKLMTEQAMAAKDRFLASASHDLRQPLNAISLFVDALHPLQTKKLGNEIVDKIRQSLKGLNGMLHSLLDISRLDAEAVKNEPKHISLNTLIMQLCDEYQEKAAHLRISCHIAPDTIVLADPTILYRIIRNLIDNAVKYTPQGEITIRSKISSPHVLNLCIEDTGVGIPSDKISTIFDEFEQLNNPERNRKKGLGLGLAIVKRLCKIAGIDISVESTVGKGTAVFLRLNTVSPLAGLQEPEIPLTNLNGRHVVVIDDEVDILIGMQHLLSNWGCKVTISESPTQALELLNNQTQVPDLIISDLRLRKNEQGTDLIDAIRHEYNKEIPAILVTGDTAPKRITQIKDSGLTVLYKPIEPDELKLQIGLLLKHD